jgi:hypothetical protein
LTNVLVTFGLTLLLSVDSRQRLTELRQKWAAWKKALVIE